MNRFYCSFRRAHTLITPYHQEMEPITYIELPSRGSSFMRVISNGKVIVRQGKHLIKIDFPSQTIEKVFEMPFEYDRNPATVYEATYIEVHSTYVFKIDINTF